MTLQERVKRAVEIKRIIEDLQEELEDIKNELDEAGLDSLIADDAKAIKVVQVKRLFSQNEACKLLGSKAASCFYDKPVIYWRFYQ